MSNLSDFVNLVTTSGSVTLTRPGFGTALLVCQNLPAGFGLGVIKTYTSLKDMTTDGFAVTHPAYQMASALKSQNPSPAKWKIGRRTAAIRNVTLTVTDSTVGGIYKVTVDGKALTYTVPVAATTTSIATALAALVAPTSQLVTATAAAAVVTLAGPSGVVFDVADWTANLQVADTSVNANVAADLAAISSADADWFGFALDATSKAEALAAAAFAEANKKLLGVATSDYAVTDSASTTDVVASLKSSSYFWTWSMHHNTQLLAYANVALFGNRFPFDPGNETWGFKTLAGVRASVYFSGAQEGNVWAKNGNTFTTTASANLTQKGQVAAGEWIDVVRFRAWLESEISIRVVSALANAPKIPYTDAGVDSIVSVLDGALKEGIRRGGLSDSPAPVISAPLVASVDSTTRGTRRLPNVNWSARLSGAIQAVDINGFLSV